MSRDLRIDAYIERAAPFARPILEHVRSRVHALVPDAEEAIKWSMPAFLKGGAILVIAAAFKNHVAINFWRGKEIESSHQTVGGMGQFGRLTSLADLPPPEEFDRLILEAAARAGSRPAPRKPAPQPRTPVEVHPAFAAALEENPNAKVVLDAFPPSARRDYLEWIAEAKTEATRAKRIATALEWLGEGKRRNWQYERSTAR